MKWLLQGVIAIVAVAGPILSLTGIAAAGQHKSASTDDGDWTAIFNGKNLKGWTPKFAGQNPGVNLKDTFRVKDGKLTISYENYDKFKKRFGHLFYKTPYSHYRLRIEYRFAGQQCDGGPDWAFRNNGVMLHSQPVGEMSLKQEFPTSIEAQLLGGRAKGKRATANLCTPGTHVRMDGKLHKKHCTRSNSKTYRSDQWVTATFVVRGHQRITHYVNGKQVMTYTRPILNDGTRLRKGYIALQAESHPTEFRTIKIQPIDKDAPVETASANATELTDKSKACCGGAAAGE